MISLDIESLYTSIPQLETLRVIESILSEIQWEYRTPRHFVINLDKIALANNFFELEGTLYLQSHGTSMGSTFVPSLANLYVHEFKKKLCLL